MTAIPIVGKCFDRADKFLAYLDSVTFNLWRPRFVTLHHTGAPDLKTWHGWQTRAKPVTDEQWMKNLASYYGNEMWWSAGPHFFVTPKNICVLSPPNVRGVHAASFNSVSWGVECVGDFDRERLEGPLETLLVDALAVMHIAAGLQPEPFTPGVRGLHFHRDDPKTKKTCPGKNITKGGMVAAVLERMADMTRGDHDSEVPLAALGSSKLTQGTVTTNDLNVRAAASGKAPVLASFDKGTLLNITNRAINGGTLWLNVADAKTGQSGWVAGRYVDLKD